jgi:acyl-CoA synthetase (AMP-forming)/AMP-acid ligase II
VKDDHLPMVITRGEVDAIVTDEVSGPKLGPPTIPYRIPLTPADSVGGLVGQTEWILMTSATTGAPKMVVHDLASLTDAIKPRSFVDPITWATFYDIRRYGGLQIFLRSILTASSMVLSDPEESASAFLRRLGTCGVTHISGTPTHWRRALMSGSVDKIDPKYIRLSGEIADQAILDNLRAFFPRASIGHAYASTEAGVAFEVDDGFEGFSVSLMGDCVNKVEMRVEEGSLRVRSPRVASRYLGIDDALADDEGFVDTGDMLEKRDARYYFVGRRSGIINVGGLKVHPEEVEKVINLHRDVRFSLVKARRSPITGALVVADVVLKDERLLVASSAGEESLKDEILSMCRAALPPHKVPAMIRFVPSLAIASSGKLARSHA